MCSADGGPAADNVAVKSNQCKLCWAGGGPSAVILVAISVRKI